MIYSAFRWCINLNFEKLTLMFGFVVQGHTSNRNSTDRFSGFNYRNGFIKTRKSYIVLAALVIMWCSSLGLMCLNTTVNLSVLCFCAQGLWIWSLLFELKLCVCVCVCVCLRAKERSASLPRRERGGLLTLLGCSGLTSLALQRAHVKRFGGELRGNSWLHDLNKMPIELNSACGKYFLLCENAFVGGECCSDVMGGWSLIHVNEIIKLRPLEAHPPRKFELWLKWTIYMGLINIGVFRHFNLKNDYELNISALNPVRSV